MRQSVYIYIYTLTYNKNVYFYTSYKRKYHSVNYESESLFNKRHCHYRTL